MKNLSIGELPVLPQLPGESTRWWAYRCLLDSIVSIALEPGRTLPEQEVAGWLGISRTPVRDALFQLSQEHFVTIVPQSRTMAAKIDRQRVEDSRYIRRCIEMDVMRQLAGRLDEEHILTFRYILQRQELAHKRDSIEMVHRLDEDLHRAFFEAAGMPRMWDNVSRINLHFQRVRALYNKFDRSTQHIIGQHTALIDALEAGDCARAADLMGRHLSPEGWDITALQRAVPQYFT